MLARTLREHAAKQAVAKGQQDRLRKEALASVTTLTEALIDILNQRVSEVFTNQKQLEVEAKNLQTQSAKYAKQTSQWLAMIDSFNNALKRASALRQELGDVQSWAQSIENDMRTIASALEYVHQGSGANLNAGDGDDYAGGD